MSHVVKWIDNKREPQIAPNPNFPHGRDLDSGREPSCFVALPYPAKRCGLFIVTCEICGTTVAITTAGRTDDPRSVKVPCEKGTLQ